MKKRIASILMALILCLTLLPTTTYAAEDGSSSVSLGTGGLCEHHTIHDEACGYTEGTEEVPCTHEHGAECYTETINCIHIHTEDCYPVSDSSISDGEAMQADVGSVEDAMPTEAAEPTECSHVCSEESGCIVQELQCPHTHDEECGYVPATEAAPCTYVCDLCSLTEITAWSLVDALEVLDPASGILALSADAENPVSYDEIVDILPAQIIATTEDGTETVALDGWTCDGYPEEGAYTGSYVFAAALPEGYMLAENADSITVTVEFGGVALLADGAHEHPICGADCTHNGQHGSVSFDKKLTIYSRGVKVDGVALELDSNGYYVLPAGNYYIDESSLIDYTWFYGIVIRSDVKICMNGDNTIRTNIVCDLIRVQNGGTLTVTNCKDDGNNGLIGHVGTRDFPGRGVIVEGGATFNLYHGMIYGNEVDGNGGGVYVAGGTFNMYGGMVINNKASGSGGGIYCTESGNVTLAGMPVIRDNTLNNATTGSNLVLADSKAVTISGALTAGTNIHMARSGEIAAGFAAGVTASDVSGYFTCDTSGYSAYYDSTAGKIKWKSSSGGGHTHSWEYRIIAEDTVNAVCTNCPYSGDGGTLKIEMNQDSYVYDGVAPVASLVTDTWRAGALNEDNINYYKWSDGKWVQMDENSLRYVGNYKATYDIGDATIYTEFTIGPAHMDDQVTNVSLNAGSGQYVRIMLRGDNQEMSVVDENNILDGSLVIIPNGTPYLRLKTTAIKGQTATITLPVEDSRYNDYNIIINVTVAHNYVGGTASCSQITEEGKTLADAGLTGTFTDAWGQKVEGTLRWMQNYSESSVVLADTTQVEKDKKYYWRFYPDDSENYQTRSGSFVLYSDEPMHVHRWSTAWSHNTWFHWHECENANCSVTTDSSKDGFNGHSYTLEIVTEEALKSEATCTEAAVYYKSCVCGVISTTETFTSGSALEHDWASAWSKDSNGHWHECQRSGCSETKDFAEHTIGLEATCQSTAVCAICSEPYGDKNMNNHTGEIDVRGRIEPTTSTEGYTGDTWCLGCNTMIASGTTIPKKESGNDQPSTGGNESGNDQPSTGGNESGNNQPSSGGSDGGSNQPASGSNAGSIDSNTTSAPGTVPASGNAGSTEETPENPAAEAEIPVYVIYTVQKGDNLYTIAKKYGCTVAEIVAANSDLIKKPNLIYVGWQLRIPQEETTGADNTIGTNDTPDTVLSDNTKTGIYVVERGDNLWAISRKCGCTVNEIIALNEELITNPNLIFPGWELKIPQN